MTDFSRSAGFEISVCVCMYDLDVGVWVYGPDVSLLLMEDSERVEPL